METQLAMAALLRSLLPQRWFPDPGEAPILDGILWGAANIMAWVENLLTFVRAQGRINTAEGEFLDMAAYDYLGLRTLRRTDEDDQRFRIRIRREILRPKATRQALSDALTDLTGNRPLIFEPGRPADTGGWADGSFALDVSGGWGSRRMHNQCFVTAYRPLGEGPPGVSGWDDPQGCYGPGDFALQSERTLNHGITDDDIREAVNTTISAGTIVWLSIRPFTDTTTPTRLDIDFILDSSRLD